MFYNYKKFLSFKVLAMCDAFYRFTWANVGDFGTSSDLSSFRETQLYHALEHNEVDLPQDSDLLRSNIRMSYFFIGGAIFEIKRYFMIPYNRNVRLTAEERTFNKRLSRARNWNEEAFGIWGSKFEILNNHLDFSLKHSIMYYSSIIMLTQFCAHP